MKNKYSRSLAAAALAGAAIAAPPAQAQVTGTIDVSLKLLAACTINSQEFIAGGSAANASYDPLIFADVPTTATTATTSMSFTYVCSAGTASTLSLGGGSQPNATLRRMIDGSAPANHIPYQLFLNTANGTEIGLTSPPITLVAGGVAKTIVIHAAAAIPTGLPPGLYTDEITVTLTL